MTLSTKQKMLVEEYLIDLNATQAAIRAGYSKKTAAQTASRLLTDVKIQRAIAEAQAARSKRTEITQDRVLQELASIGFSDIRRIFSGNQLLSPDEWPDDVASAISAAEFNTRNLGKGEIEHVVKLKLWDKGRALEAIARHLGMMRQDVNLNVTGGVLVAPTTTDMETWQAQAQQQQQEAKSPSQT